MTTTYNIEPHGAIVNTNGVLSNFVAETNYALIPTVFNPSTTPFEWGMKFTTGASIERQYITGAVHCFDLYINNNKLYIDFGTGSDWDTDFILISGTTTLTTNTTYYTKLVYSGSDYKLYLSTTPTFSNTPEMTINRSAGFASYQIPLGSLIPNETAFLGTIDLDGCYINLNGVLWWKGVTGTSNVTTHIQLRHDVAFNWATVNPVLYEGEVGIETDTGKFKIGDGISSYQALPYSLGSTALQPSQADGQYTAKYLQIDSTKTAHAISADLSTYINDSTTASYEVLVELNIASNNTTYLFVGNVASPYTNKGGNAFCVGTNTTSGATQAHMVCWVPLATSSRTLYCQLGGSSASSSADINLLGYRRLGTNS